MEYHPVCELFPVYLDPDFDQLCADIQAHGLLEPIVTWQGQIIDGRTRHRACLRVGVTPRFREWDGRGSLVEYVMSLNFHRRHMSAGQRAMVAAKALPLLEEEARKRQGHGTTKPGKTDTETLRAKLPEASKGRATEKAAATAGVSARTVQDAKKVREKAVPEVVQAVERGEMSVSSAAKLADLSPQEQFAALVDEEEAQTDSAMPVMAMRTIRWLQRERGRWVEFAKAKAYVRTLGIAISQAEDLLP